MLGASFDDGRFSLVCLRAGWGRPEVVGALRTGLPANAEEEPAFLSEVAAFTLSNRIPSGARVVLGVPRGGFFLRRFEIPPVKPRELPELVAFEIARHLPGKREEFLGGWTLAGRTPGGGHEVILGAARRAPVERVGSLLGRAGLAPWSIQPEPSALAGVLARQEPALREVLLVRLGPSDVGVDLVRAGRLELTRLFVVDEPAWREVAAREEGEDRSEAARKLGEHLARRIREPAFLDALPGGTIPEVRVTGTGSNSADLTGRLQGGLGVPVRVFSPWQQVLWSGPPRELGALTVALSHALCAVWGKNAGLELSEERQERLHRAPSRRPTVVLAALAAILLAANVTVSGLQQQRRLDLIEERIRGLKEQTSEVERERQRVEGLRERIAYLRGRIDERPAQAEILKELTMLLPQDTHLAEYSFREGAIEITGLAPAASRLLPLLEQSALFAAVEFSAPIVAQGAGLERFRIRMRYEGAGA